MHRQGFGLLVLHQAENRADGANDDAQIHQRGAADAAQPVKFHLCPASGIFMSASLANAPDAPVNTVNKRTTQNHSLFFSI